MIRALALGVIGCAGLGYAINLGLLLRRLAAPEEIEALWDIVLPLFASCVLGGGLGPQSPVRRFERGGRGRGPTRRGPTHCRPAQKLGGDPVPSEP